MIGSLPFIEQALIRTIMNEMLPFKKEKRNLYKYWGKHMGWPIRSCAQSMSIFAHFFDGQWETNGRILKKTMNGHTQHMATGRRTGVLWEKKYI